MPFKTQTILGVSVLSSGQALGLASWVRNGRWVPTSWVALSPGLLLAATWEASQSFEAIVGLEDEFTQLAANAAQHPRAGMKLEQAVLVSQLGSVTWPASLCVDTPHPRALLVRGSTPESVNGWNLGTPRAELAALDVEGPLGGAPWLRLFDLCSPNKVANPWAVWLTSPNLWPLWIASEAARLAKGPVAPAAKGRVGTSRRVK